MKIYCAHSSAHDYLNEFYKPIQESDVFKKHEFIFPHTPGEKFSHSKPIIETCDLVLAEVSFPSIGLGIEMGWANAASIKIWAIHQQDKSISSSIKVVASQIHPYQSLDDILQHL